MPPARWNAAIETVALLKPASWKRAGSTFTLADGRPTRYGAGWMLGRLGSHSTLEHGGGINGFNAYMGTSGGKLIRSYVGNRFTFSAT